MGRWLSILYILIHCHYSSAEMIPVATVDWCPQMCPGEEQPGYVIDILMALYQDSDYQLHIEAYPWSRGLKRTHSGDNLAMLAPTKKETPEMLFPAFSLGSQRMCLYTRADSNWVYSGPTSLAGLQIGMAYDTQIEGITDYAQHHPEQFQMQPYHSRYFMQNVGKVKKGRIDAFIYTYQSTIWEARENGIVQDIRLAGCTPGEPIYIAFTAKLDQRERVNNLIQHFEQGYKALQDSGRISEIMAQYGLVSYEENNPGSHPNPQ